MNHRIRRLDPVDRTVTTVAGNGTAGYSGDGGPALRAQLHRPTRVAVDCAGNLYISDSWNDRIRRVDARTQTITTIAGTGIPGYSGDGGNASAAAINTPFGLLLDTDTSLIFCDSRNVRVRKITNLQPTPLACAPPAPKPLAPKPLAPKPPAPPPPLPPQV